VVRKQHLVDLKFTPSLLLVHLLFKVELKKLNMLSLLVAEAAGLRGRALVTLAEAVEQGVTLLGQHPSLLIHTPLLLVQARRLQQGQG
jgi:hypothetical protein